MADSVQTTFFTKKRILARTAALETRRSVHYKDWQKITEVIRPTRGQYLDGDAPELSKRPTSMVNSTPAVASRTLQAGMISGASSPAYNWFKLYLDDDELNKWGPAKIALEQRERILSQYLARSNFYQTLQTVYGDAADFGTGAGIIDPHPRDIFTAKAFSPGEYLVDVDAHGDIDTLVRKVPWTTLQLVSRFGLERVSRKVRESYDKGDYQTPFVVIECIEPNQLAVGVGPGSGTNETWKNKPWVKFVFEVENTEDGEAAYLEISGYNEWPGFNLRWDIASGNIWGQGCGTLALGDAAALQTLEFRDAQAIEKAVKPSLQAPVHLKNVPISQAPGGVTYYDPYTANGNKVEPVYQISPGILTALDQKRLSLERRVNEVYFKDLFLMLATTDRREITAREVEEKHQEKLLALGPVLMRTHRDALNNAIMRIYNMLDRAGLFPEAPPELRGREVTVRYTSVLAYAQKAGSAASIERFFGFTGNLAGAYPQARFKVNVNKGLDYYADAIGVPAEIMVDDQTADAESAKAAQAAAGPAQAGALKDTAQAAQLLSQTDTTRPSPLSFLLQRGGLQ